MRAKTICMSVFNDLSMDARVYREARTLQREGYEVSVVGIKERGSAPDASWPGIRMVRIPIGLGRKPFAKARYLEHFLKLTATLLRTKADAYHAHDLDTLLACWVASRAKRAKLVYDVHEMMVEESAVQKRPVTRAIWLILERLLICKADAVLTVNNSIAAELARRYQIEPPRVLMNCPELRRIAKTGELRKILKIGPSQWIVLHQGGLLPGSGLEVLVESLRRVENVVLVFLGRGPAREQLQLMADSMGLGDRVRFLDPVPFEALPRYTASSDLGLAIVKNAGLSYFLSLPNKIFDYMMAGVPILTSNFPERQRIVTENGTGLAVDPSDPRRVAQGIESILKDRESYRKMAANCRRAAKRYNWERESVKLTEIYQWLFREDQASPHPQRSSVRTNFPGKAQ